MIQVYLTIQTAQFCANCESAFVTRCLDNLRIEPLQWAVPGAVPRGAYAVHRMPCRLSNTFHAMSTVAEIEAAIKALPPSERERLAEKLPSILPELRGDIAWQRIISDERPRPSLSALGDQIDDRFKAHAEQFPEIKDTDFDERP